MDLRWVAAADVVLAAAGARRARVATKPLVVPAVAAGRRPSGPLAVAWAASWLGDVALLGRSEAALLGGVGGFAVAHAGYLAAIRRRFPGPTPRRRGAAVTAVSGAVLAGAGAVLWGRVEPRLRGPVLGYAALVTGMGAAAVRAGLRTPGRAGRAVAAGGVLFVVSDGLVAATTFGGARSRAVEGAVMATYVAAQALLAAALEEVG